MNAQLADREVSPVSLGDWIITLIVLAIPIVGFVMLFVWGFADGTHPSKQNFCRAYLILMAIGVVLFVLFMATVGLGALTSLHSMGGATL
ncbi:MAG TPA: hypothetical protein VF292_13465 [Rhodanobacteraceae bacterium]